VLILFKTQKKNPGIFELPNESGIADDMSPVFLNWNESGIADDMLVISCVSRLADGLCNVAALRLSDLAVEGRLQTPYACNDVQVSPDGRRIAIVVCFKMSFEHNVLFCVFAFVFFCYRFRGD
jgi:hypothetical protein